MMRPVVGLQHLEAGKAVLAPDHVLLQEHVAHRYAFADLRHIVVTDEDGFFAIAIPSCFMDQIRFATEPSPSSRPGQPRGLGSGGSSDGCVGVEIDPESGSVRWQQVASSRHRRVVSDGRHSGILVA